MNQNYLNKKHAPFITIVIVTAPNRKKELFRCLKSIQRSTFKNYEIIVIDNSGNSNLPREVRQFFPEVILIRMPNNSGMFAYNVGFINASGKYIFALDDDCVIMKDTLDTIINFINEHQHVMVVTCNVYNPLHPSSLNKERKKTKQKPPLTFMGGASVFKKEIFEKVGYYDSDFFCWRHELDLSIRILNAGYTIDFGGNIRVRHYEKQLIRKEKIFFDARNKAWFNIKNFSILFLPLLVIRDFAWLLLLVLRHKNILASLYGITGYIWGCLTFIIPLRKKVKISKKIQFLYLKQLLLN
jgi:GT2 family glycosyltransferase